MSEKAETLRHVQNKAWNKGWQRIHLDAAIAAQNRLANPQPHHNPALDLLVAIECWSATIARGHVDA